MKDQKIDPWLSGTRRALRLLAAPADVQRAHLNDLGVPGIVDELALEFDDMNRPLKSVLQVGEAQEALGAVEAALAAPDLEWTLDALEESASWQRVRELAADALRATESLG